tara:strand:- start:439 stop:687 length:249 start_codon:yes stop_codon:yes gene_type:complete
MKIDTEADYVIEAYCWSSYGVKNKKEKNVLACIARYRNHDYEEIKEILEIIDLRDRLISLYRYHDDGYVTVELTIRQEYVNE